MKYNRISIMQSGCSGPLFHDCIWNNLIFEYSSKQIIVQLLSNEETPRIIEVIFENVIAFNMICCDFWGKSPHIDCIMIAEETGNNLIKHVFSEKEHCDYGVSCLKSKDDYIEATVSSISGDRLIIACECVICETGDGETGDGTMSCEGND